MTINSQLKSMQSNINHNDDLMQKSWRVVTPAKAESQNYQEAFQLRENENALSFFVNSSLDLDSHTCQNEILKICEERKLTIKNNTHLIMIDLINAIDEINTNGKELVSAIIDNFPHCSFYYENGSYDNDAQRAEIMLSLYYNIIDDFTATKQTDGSIYLTKG